MQPAVERPETQLIGTWELVSFSVTATSGDVSFRSAGMQSDAFRYAV
jgi:hypothetical protein